MPVCHIIGVDLGKNSFNIHGANRYGRKLFSHKLSRKKLAEFIANQKPCKIAMEACSGSHFWAQKFRSFGHDVVLIAPQFVKPYVKRDKTDAADAEAIYEAASRETMRFVPIKTKASQDLCSLSRMRELCVKQRTALSNHIRGILAEYDIIAPKGIKSLRVLLSNLSSATCDDIDSGIWGDITPIIKTEMSRLYDELIILSERISDYEQKIKDLGEKDDRYLRLVEIPGVGPLTAAGILGSVGHARVFSTSRQFASWLGLVPREHSTGGKQRLGAISKRGDSYLRKLLIHGARSLLIKPKPDDYRRTWAHSLKDRKGLNKAAVALANRNARVIWALLTKGEKYNPCHLTMYATS